VDTLAKANLKDVIGAATSFQALLPRRDSSPLNANSHQLATQTAFASRRTSLDLARFDRFLGSN
jgi:hypothetical protein